MPEQKSPIPATKCLKAVFFQLDIVWLCMYEDEEVLNGANGMLALQKIRKKGFWHSPPSWPHQTVFFRAKCHIPLFKYFEHKTSIKRLNNFFKKEQGIGKGGGLALALAPSNCWSYENQLCW